MKNKFWPLGFSASGLDAGISYKKGKKDLALFSSGLPAHGAAVFTNNVVKAAPVITTQKAILETRGRVRAIVVNSGSANAATGVEGLRDAATTARWAAEMLAIDPNEVWLASTGVIGPRLKMPQFEKGIKKLARKVATSALNEGDLAAEAILTTDTFPKVAGTAIKIHGVPIRIWGCAKGSGMIHPNLRGPRGKLHATMLSFILTDASITAPVLQRALEWVCDRTFNCVSIDGDTSTNDFVGVMANGAAGAPEILHVRDKQYRLFRDALFGICDRLTDVIAVDGEGASRLVYVNVCGARSEKSARQIASVISSSPLVKTACHGADPNWGRILAAVGRAGVPFDPHRVHVWIGDTLVCKSGKEHPFPEKKVMRYMRRKKIAIRVDLGLGHCSSQYKTCDFTGHYVGINAGYRT